MALWILNVESQKAVFLGIFFRAESVSYLQRPSYRVHLLHIQITQGRISLPC